MATSDLNLLSDAQLIAHWSLVVRELHNRKLIRTFNNPVADVAERIVSGVLGLTLASKSTAGFDATDAEGLRYQIKSRRILPGSKVRQLGVIRNLCKEDTEDPFDVLAVAFFDEALILADLWLVPIEIVRKYAEFRDHVNGHVLHMKGPILNDPNVQHRFRS